MKINRLLVNICSDNLDASKSFYTSLFDFKLAFDSDWFVQLISADSAVELGIIDRHQEVVPAGLGHAAAGFYMTFVVEDVDALYAKAQSLGYNVIENPKDTFYGQRRMLIKDPDGVTLDVSAPMAGFGA